MEMADLIVLAGSRDGPEEDDALGAMDAPDINSGLPSVFVSFDANANSAA